MSMQSFRMPEKLYFKQGCLPVALQELVDVYQVQRVLILTDEVMLHNGRLAPLTGALYDMGLDYAVNSESFAADCVIGFGFAQALDRAAAFAGDKPFIAVPVSAGGQMSIPAWRKADMFILDEDVCVPIPAGEICSHIAQTARASLAGANVSDYTLALSVQALRILFDKAHTTSALLHAAAMAQLAYTTARSDEVPTDNLFEDAAEALGMSVTELENQINSAVTAQHT
ncbi:MAG: hypothetical protein K5695_12245 [Oscillospiraceae bacterium]|nr:hypothetical protein [Oscillospiraceae bacterium]